MAPVLIDHSAYPEILDLVVSYASLTALISLRATCKSIQRVADARLFAHVQLLDFHGSRVPRSRRRYRRATWRVGLTLPVNSNVSHERKWPRLPWVPGAVKIIHEPSHQMTCWMDREAADLFTSVHTLLRHQLPLIRRGDKHREYPISIKAHTMVAFLNRWFYGKIQIEDACRLVLHVKDDPNRYMQTGFNFGFSSRLDRLRQVVIVLHPEGPRISTPGGDRYLIPLLGDWLAMFRSRSSQCKFTFVGLEQRGQQVDMVERELHAMCAKGQPSDYKLPSLSKFRERVTFTTLQDWRAELRREGKVIEGVWAEPR